MPKISVIIPVYNTEKYLSSCLESVINQSMKDIEIICVNDGSTDSSLDILNEYAQKDNRIVIFSKKNNGLGAARNSGIEIATGEYTCFLDSDDWLALDFIEKLYNKCEKHNAEVAIGMTDYWWGPNKVSIDQWVNQKAFEKNIEIFKTVNEKQHIIYSCACWNKLYKTDFIKRHNLRFPENILVEDVPFTFLTAVLANKIVADKTAHLYYRQRNNSIINSIGASEKIFDIFKIYEIVQSSLDNLEIDSAIKSQYQNVLDNFKIFNCYAYYKQGTKPIKKEFFKRLKKEFSQISLKDNVYITDKNIKIYEACIKSGNVKSFEKSLKSNFAISLSGGLIKSGIKYDYNKAHKIYKIGSIKFKTKLDENFSVERAKNIIDENDYISFDIFDTLLLRPYAKPTDLFKHIESNYKADGFVESRIKAEKLAAADIRTCLDEEYTLDLIYKYIDEKYKDFKSIELKYEESVLFKNPEIYKIYQYALSKNKKIFIISDMYLPKTFIENVLNKNGYNQYEKIYLSSEYKKCKWSGSLYRVVKDDIKDKQAKIIHFGDNRHSDVIKASEEGFAVCYYPKVIDRYLARSKKAKYFYEQNWDNLGASILIMHFALDKTFENYWNKIGYKYAGPVCYGYVQWLNERFKEDKIDDALFVARDGYTLKRIFELLENNCKSHYIYAPRFLSAICTLSFKKEKTDTINAIINHYMPNFDRNMTLQIENAENDEERYNFLVKYLNKINESAETERENYRKYLSNYINSMSSRCALIDTITMHFSSQRLIENVLDKENVIGYYWSIIPNSEQKFFKYKDYYPDYRCSESVNCWNFMELLMTAPEYPIHSIENNKPVYKSNITDEEKFRQSIASYISDSAVEFTKDLLSHFNCIPVSFTHKEIADWVNVLSTTPDEDDLKNMKQVRHAEDAEHTRYVELFPEWKNIGNSTEPKIHKFIKTLGKVFYYKQKNWDKTVKRIRIFGIEVYKKKIDGYVTRRYILGLRYSKKFNLKGLLEDTRWAVEHTKCEVGNVKWQVDNVKSAVDNIMLENQQINDKICNTNDLVLSNINRLQNEIINNKNSIIEYLNIDGRFEQANQLINNLKCDINFIVQKNLETALLHQKTFSQYKNMYQGRDVVLIAAGPTLNKFEHINGAIYVGCNRTFKKSDIDFDYLFAIDKVGIQDCYGEFINYKKDSCVKFLGNQDLGVNYQIPEDIISNIEYVRRYNTDTRFPWVVSYPLDISSRPLFNSCSVAIQAMQFCLYTNPRRIYIVGVDCTCATQGHFDNTHLDCSFRNENLANNDYWVVEHWNKLKEFAQTYYPNTEIISINPVGLKGIFKDEYTKEYCQQ